MRDKLHLDAHVDDSVVAVALLHLSAIHANSLYLLGNDRSEAAGAAAGVVAVISRQADAAH